MAEMQDFRGPAGGKGVSPGKWVFIISLGMLVVGTIGYFLLGRDVWLFYASAHLGALGVMGLAGAATGALARRKNRSYWTAFSIGCLLPIVVGIIAVLIFWAGEEGRLYCGGSVSLFVALLAIVVYSLVGRRIIARNT